MHRNIDQCDDDGITYTVVTWKVASTIGMATAGYKKRNPISMLLFVISDAILLRGKRFKEPVAKIMGQVLSLQMNGCGVSDACHAANKGGIDHT